MDTKTYTTIDRKAAQWPSGEWDNEPDKMQWPDAVTGLPCLAVRHSRRGHWCGYVGVAPEHSLHGKDYSDEAVNAAVECGLTFSEACSPRDTEAEGICHIPGEGEPDHVWWFGFDCAHCYDHSPYDVLMAQTRGHPFTLQPNSVYRTLEYVRERCAALAAQLAKS